MAPWVWVLIVVGWLALSIVVAFVLAGAVRLNQRSTRDRLDVAARATGEPPCIPSPRPPPAPEGPACAADREPTGESQDRQP